MGMGKEYVYGFSMLGTAGGARWADHLFAEMELNLGVGLRWGYIWRRIWRKVILLARTIHQSYGRQIKMYDGWRVFFFPFSKSLGLNM